MSAGSEKPLTAGARVRDSPGYTKRMFSDIMRKRRRNLFLFHRDRLFGARVADACKGHYDLTVFGSVEELGNRLRVEAPSTPVIVDPLSGGAGAPRLSAEFNELLRLFPSAIIVPAVAMVPGSFDVVRKLGRSGVVQVICLEEDTTAAAIRQRVADARGRPLRNLIARSLPPTTSAMARSILDRAVEVFPGGGGSVALAKSMFVTNRTLLRWCTKGGLPPPRRLLLWVRLLYAAELLEDLGRTVFDVALACGYSSDGALRNATRAAMGVSPGQLRAEGAFRVVSATFIKEIEQSRTVGLVTGALNAGK
jgi:AraC-like DNA-binding protein